MAIRAKFKCATVDNPGYAELVTLEAVYDADPGSENYSWSSATPVGLLSMTISNKAAWGALEVGKEYYIDVTPVGSG